MTFITFFFASSHSSMKTWIKIDLNRAFGKNLVLEVFQVLSKIYDQTLSDFLFTEMAVAWRLKIDFWRKNLFKVFGPKWTQNKVFQVTAVKRVKIDPNDFVGKNFLLWSQGQKRLENEVFSSFMSNWKICF